MIHNLTCLKFMSELRIAIFTWIQTIPFDLYMIDIKNIKSRKVMTYKVKCLRNVLVFIFLINIFLNKVNKSLNKPLQNLLCAIDIQIQL